MPDFSTLPGAVPIAQAGGLGTLSSDPVAAAQPGGGGFNWLSLLGFGGNQNQQSSAAPNVNIPGAAGSNGLGVGLGANIGTGQLALGGLSALGNLWTAWNASKLAKESFNFNKTLASDNYTNQSQAYNTNLEDTARARGVMENQTPGQVQNYIAGHSVKTTV